jgi:peptidoglycan hydrolase-like protein with peptidoglycan-binding domain
MSRTVRRGLLATAILAVVVAGFWSTRRMTASPPDGAAGTVNLTTATVVRTDLRTTRQYYGSIGFGAPTELVAASTGRAYTWLPAPGTVIRADESLYEVDGRAVPVLPGARPMWRTLQPGVRGADVAQLNTALTRLGYAPAVAGSNVYSWRTKAAVRHWQRAHHVSRTGIVELGQLVFARTPLRVGAVHARIGAPASQGDPLLSATAPAVVVDLPVPVDQAYLLHPGAPVVVTLPDAVTRTPGTVTVVSRVATLPDPESANVRQGNPDAAVVDATIALRRPALAARYTSAPVNVAVTLDQARHVLAVPIAALLARPGGGYAVTVVNGARRTDVAVSTGLYTDTMVQVSGTGITAGTRVVVAAS